jgi:hypothetical protein
MAFKRITAKDLMKILKKNPNALILIGDQNIPLISYDMIEVKEVDYICFGTCIQLTAKS